MRTKCVDLAHMGKVNQLYAPKPNIQLSLFPSILAYSFLEKN